MVFSKEEKKACIHILVSLTDCDGKRNLDEIRELSNCSSKMLGVSQEEFLSGLIWDACTMSRNDIESIVKSMDEEKKIILEKCMDKVIEADGPANEIERMESLAIKMIHELPSWKSRKNNE